MAEPISIQSALGIDKLGSIGLGSTFLNVLLVIIVAVIVLGLTGVLVTLWIISKQYKYRIPLYAKVGNITTRIANLKAKEVPFGRAGDKLWFCKGKGVRKWIPPAAIQSAPNEFWHYVREDGEWINFNMEDIDQKSKLANVKYTSTPMRLQRLATDRILEQEYVKKSFWEKWGVVVGYVIFFLVITIAFVVFFHQYGKVIEQQAQITANTNEILERAIKYENQAKGRDIDNSGLIPALFLALGDSWRQAQ